MVDRTNPSALRWLIGVELAHFRNRAGLDQQTVARRSGVGRGKVSHYETGERKQNPAEVAKIMEACGAPLHEINRLTTLAEVPDESTWWGAWSDVVPDWFGTFVGLERLATKEFVFEPIVIPGLMQTEDYARALSRSSQRVRIDHSERVVELRMERALRLTAENPLHLHAAVNEQALRLSVGTPDIMREQYQHLINLARQPHITLQVVVPERGRHDATAGQFFVLDFDKARSIAYAELQDGAIYIQHPGRVDTYKESSRSLQEVALPPEDSVKLVAELIKKL